MGKHQIIDVDEVIQPEDTSEFAIESIREAWPHHESKEDITEHEAVLKRLDSIDEHIAGIEAAFKSIAEGMESQIDDFINNSALGGMIGKLMGRDKEDGNS